MLRIQRGLPGAVLRVELDSYAAEGSHGDESCAHVARTERGEEGRQAEIVAAGVAHRRCFAMVVKDALGRTSGGDHLDPEQRAG